MKIAKIEVYGNDINEVAKNLEKLISDFNQSKYPEDGISLFVEPVCAPEFVVKIEDDPTQLLSEIGPMPNPGKLVSYVICARCGAKTYRYERATMYTCDCHRAG
jgi:hypothetical protein